mmetsp:Transcript_27009/g.56281  ORF Transcript_27009/g.56281 Transcript_27009/m.56281 type:complete len:270 (-) Transcript_27009:681-1490(-)
MAGSDGSTKKQKKLEMGFNMVQSILGNTFYGLLSFKPPLKTADGNTKTAYKRLKTAFTVSLKAKSATPRQLTPPRQSTPRSGTEMPLRATTISTCSSTGSLPSLISTETSIDIDSSLVAVGRLEKMPTSMSSENQGMKRLRIQDVLKLMSKECFTLVVLSVDAKQPRSTIKPHNSIKTEFHRVILSAASSLMMNADKKEIFYKEDLSIQTIPRDGKDNIEYNVHISYYAERSKLSRPNPLQNNIDYMLGCGNAGIRLESMAMEGGKQYC